MENLVHAPPVNWLGGEGVTNFLANLAVVAPVDQHYLLQARQMQAFSFAVHIPLVCFGISLPVMVLFAELLYLRSGDPVYRTVARRWSRVMVTLFAVGVITGTVLSFEMGLQWPNFTGTFGSVVGLGFAGSQRWAACCATYLPPRRRPPGVQATGAAVRIGGVPRSVTNFRQP